MSSQVERALVRGSANEVRAWHGTKLENIGGIVTGGFTLNPWTRNGNLYGETLKVCGDNLIQRQIKSAEALVWIAFIRQWRFSKPPRSQFYDWSSTNLYGENCSGDPRQLRHRCGSAVSMSSPGRRDWLATSVCKSCSGFSRCPMCE